MVRSTQAHLAPEDYADGATAEFDAEPGLLNPGLQWLGSGIIEWVKSACFRGETYDVMDAEAEVIPPGCDGVTMVPDFLASGEGKGFHQRPSAGPGRAPTSTAPPWRPSPGA